MAGMPYGYMIIYVRSKASQPSTDSPGVAWRHKKGSLLFIISVHFPIKNTLKKRTRPKFSYFDLMGVKIFSCGRCTKRRETVFRPPLYQLLTCLARSKNGWAKQRKAEPGVRKKPRWRPAENMAFFDHVVLDQKHAFDVQIPYIVFLSVWRIYL